MSAPEAECAWVIRTLIDGRMFYLASSSYGGSWWDPRRHEAYRWLTKDAAVNDLLTVYKLNPKHHEVIFEFFTHD